MYFPEKQWDGLLLTHDTASRCQTGWYEPPVKNEKESTMKIMRIGVDLAKNVYVRPESRLSFCFTGGIKA